MKKRIVSIVLAVCLVVSLCAALGTGVSAYSTEYPNTYTNTGDQRTDVVQIAMTQLGYTFDSGTKYGAWWGQTIGSSYDYTNLAWCAMFILWCENQAGNTTAYNSGSALCSTMLDYYRSGQNGNAAYVYGSGYVPRPGDIVFIAYSNASTDHVGLVTSVTDTTIYTVEGNYSNKVSASSYDRATGWRTGSIRHIIYIGVPNYANDGTSADFSGPTSSGTDSSTTGGTDVSYTTYVTAGSLNVRELPTLSGAVLSTLTKGAEAAIVKEATSADGTLWGQISSGGWIALAYTDKNAGSAGSTGSSTDTPITAYQAKVTCDILTIRADAGTGSSQIGSLRQGDTVTIVAKKTSGSLEWGQIESGGWIALKYTAAAEAGAETPSEPATPAEPTAAYTASVTASLLNVRSEPVSGSITATLSRGTSVTIVAESNGWGQLESGGWVSLTYLAKTDGSASSGSGTGSAPAADAGTAVTVTGTTVNVRTGAGTGNGIASTVTKGASLTIVETAEADGSLWGRLSSGGWICLTYTTYSGSGSSSESNSGSGSAAGAVSATVTASVLNVRNTPGTGSVVGALYRGNTVTITETTSVDNVTWGKTDAGWISMDYVSTSGSGSASVGSGTTVTITGSLVNVRSGAGTGNSIVTTLTKGTTVTVISETTVSSTRWGQLSTGGWICMDYAR